MKKLTNTQIREQVRKELTKSFEQKYERYIKDVENFKELYHNTLEEKRELAKEIFTLTGENDALKEKVNQYEDWIRRLQEFMDMEPTAREDAIQKFKIEKSLNEKMNDLFNFYGIFTSI